MSRKARVRQIPELEQEGRNVRMMAMRLIDLDAKIIITVTDETKGGMVYEEQMTLAEFFSKCVPYYQPEIVDAIPVEWLKKQVKEYPKTLWGSMCMDVLEGWRKGRVVR